MSARRGMGRGLAAILPETGPGEPSYREVPVDLILAASLLSRPLPNAGDWDLRALRQIDLLLHGLGRSPSTV